MKNNNLGNSLSTNTDEAPTENANVVDALLTSSNSQSEVANDRKRARNEKSTSISGKRNKITKAQLEAKISELTKKQLANDQEHNIQIDSFQSKIDRMVNKQEDGLSKNLTAEEMRNQVNQMKGAFNDMKKKYEADVKALDKGIKARNAELQMKRDSDIKLFENEKQKLEQKYSTMKDALNGLEEKHGTDRATHDKAYQTLEATLADLEHSVADINTVVIKKLIHTSSNVWDGYVTLEENEVPAEISIDDNNALVINGVTSPKELVLNGIISDYYTNPFDGGAELNMDAIHGKNISLLLDKVESCNISDLYLWSQYLSWKEYEKLATGGTIKNLYLCHVEIKDDDGADVPLDKILEKVPDLERLDIDDCYSIKQETFQNLAQLPVFKNLQLFKVIYINHEKFDMDSFFEFMQKHPSTHFTLHFITKRVKYYAELLMENMLKLCPNPAQLELLNQF